MKRFLLWMRAFVTILICIPVLLIRTQAAGEGNLSFRLNADGEGYTVADCSSSATGDLVIPSMYNGQPVTSIGDYAFHYCSSLTSITIPDSVTSIGSYAFNYCSSLTSITIPDSVTSIGDWAFYSCDSLTSVTIGDGVTSIGDYAFNFCSSLTGIWVEDRNTAYSSDENGVLYNKEKTVLIQAPAKGISGAYTIPDSVTSIGEYAFRYCNSLTSVIIGDGVTNIGDSAFNSCSSLTSITIPDSVTAIPDYAFGGCSSLTSITIPDSVTSIGDYAFNSCSSLTSITIPDSVTSIGDCAFEHCSSLTSITIPDSVTSIGYYAFYECTSLTSVTIGDGVTSIGDRAFNSCDSLTSIWVEDRNTDYSSDENGVLYNKEKPVLIQAPAKGISGAYTIPDGVTSIGNRAFYNCSSLTSITIPDSVTSIGFSAFYNCSSLTSITIPDGVTSIVDRTFYNCSSLTSITIPDSVTSIGDSAFEDCSGLTHVAFTGTVSQWNSISIGFYNSNLTSATRHYETAFRWEKNCVNTGLFCPVCNKFLTKENPEDGKHSYTDVGDISCNDCDFVQSISSINIYLKPSNLKFDLFTGVLDVLDGVLQVKYNDGGLAKVAMTLDMVSGFDNTKIGAQTLTVTYEGKTTTYTVEIVPGTPNGIEIWTMPKTLDYITGAQLDLTGLSLLAYYPGNLTVEIPLADITVDSVDMSTPGIKTVRIGYKGVYTSFSIYVHTKQTVTLDSTTYPESSHNYASNTNESKTFTYPGADGLVLTFNSSSYTESNFDWVYLYDGAGNQIGKYSGSLSGKVVTIPGDTFTIQLTSDSSVNKYGYAFSSIVAEAILHNYENNVCTICGRFEHGLVLTQNMVINENLDQDLYIDLAGFDLSGTIVTNGYKVYGMDSATNAYTCDTMGYFSCVDENGNPIVPESLYTHADAKRYMTIETESGYTFHRFYLGITNISLVPVVTGFGYKAEFYGDEMVQAQIASIGYNLWLDGGKKVSRTTNFKNSLTLRLKSFDVVNHGETPVHATATITLANGTMIESSTTSYSMRQMVEMINNDPAHLNALQLSAVQAMIANNSVMQSWLVENIYKKS